MIGQTEGARKNTNVEDAQGRAGLNLHAWGSTSTSSIDVVVASRPRRNRTKLPPQVNVSTVRESCLRWTVLTLALGLWTTTGRGAAGVRKLVSKSQSEAQQARAGCLIFP